jgi:hypothetical protein
MVVMWKIGPAMVAATLLSGSASASEFDRCVLEHMQGVSSDFAAKSIKQSCVRTAEHELPVSVVGQARAGYGNVSYGVGSDPRLVISLNNVSGYTISEITIKLERKGRDAQVYVIRDFPYVPHLLPGMIIGGPPPDPTTEMIIGPGNREFWTEVSPSPDAADFKSAPSWDVVSTKGWKD